MTAPSAPPAVIDPFFKSVSQPSYPAASQRGAFQATAAPLHRGVFQGKTASASSGFLFRPEKTLREILDEEEAAFRYEQQLLEEADKNLVLALQTEENEALHEKHRKEQEDLELARLLMEEERALQEEQRRMDEDTALTIQAMELEDQLTRMEQERLGLEAAKMLHEEELAEEARREEEKRRQAEAELERRRQAIWNATPNVREAGKRCPHCLRVIYKDVGCDNVKCVCGKSFNYGVADVIPFVDSQNIPPVNLPSSTQGATAASAAPSSGGRRILPSLFRSRSRTGAIPIAEEVDREAQDNPSCGHAAADNGPRPAFLDQFLAAEGRSRATPQPRQAQGSFECPVCADRQCDMFFPCCGGIACSVCTVHWLKDNHICLRCRQQIRQPPMRIVHN